MGSKVTTKRGAQDAPLCHATIKPHTPPHTMRTSRAYPGKTASPLALKRRWVGQDMDLQDADEMRAYDRAQYYANEDGCHTGTDSDA